MSGAKPCNTPTTPGQQLSKFKGVQIVIYSTMNLLTY